MKLQLIIEVERKVYDVLNKVAKAEKMSIDDLHLAIVNFWALAAEKDIKNGS